MGGILDLNLLKYKVVFPPKYQKLRQIYHRAERLITLSQGSYNMSQNPSKFSKALQFGARLERYIANIAAIGNNHIERSINLKNIGPKWFSEKNSHC